MTYLYHYYYQAPITLPLSVFRKMDVEPSAEHAVDANTQILVIVEVVFNSDDARRARF